MLIAYIDEFGHQGPYISHSHPKFNTHPVFGYGGYIIPDHGVRKLGGHFEYIKENLLRFEIEKAGKHPRRWEKKGSSLLSSKNIRKYGDEIQPALQRIFRKLAELEGKLFFFGKQKPIGAVKETKLTSQALEESCLIETINRLGRVASQAHERLLVVMDATDTDNRERAVATLGRTIYSTKNHDTDSIIEVPIQADSHLYGTIQLADWTCALLGRLSDYHFAESSEFGWSIDLGQKILKTKGLSFTSNSAIWSNSQERNSSCTSKELLKPTHFWQLEVEQATRLNQQQVQNQHMRQKIIEACSPELRAKLDEIRGSSH
ncbi:DUF3800 domain-containing protein [Corynebacterium durum]|uniref:DUF3800 domain-containing protein n=1 Tax=Corynebacterium durum TaxID=61592 RepID=UPI0028EE1552|nr:DUF3800 domain-containing protein [Corynebacterium durum]